MGLSLHEHPPSCHGLIHLFIIIIIITIIVRKTWRFRKDFTDCFCIYTTINSGTPDKSCVSCLRQVLYRYKQRKFLFSRPQRRKDWNFVHRDGSLLWFNKTINDY